MQRKYEPTVNRVIIRREPPKEQEGLVFIPESSREQSTIGEVVAIGPGCKSVVPGDIIATAQFRGTPVYGEDNLFVLLESDIFYTIK